jgi:transposase-like protein
MAQKIRDHCEPTCPICGISMVLVRIDPRVASFSELRTFRCFACDDLRATEQKTLLFTRVAAIDRPARTRAA